MSEVAVIVMLFGLGAAILVAELFIPSHGVLTVAGLGFLISGIVSTFQQYGQTTGSIAILSCLVVLPIFTVTAVKYWPRTWIGRRIAPPNPILTSADTSVPVVEMEHCIGRTGRSVSPLRPVGICEFDGRRVSCISEHGMVEAGVSVEGLRISGSNLSVGPVKT